MANDIETGARWSELSNMGYNLRDKDGDVTIALYFKDAYIADFEQTSVMMEEVIEEAESHHREIMGNEDYRDKHAGLQPISAIIKEVLKGG